MAKLKFAFQEEYYKTHRRQLRDYVFGYFHVAAGLASSIAPIVNTLMEVEPVKNLVAKSIGLTAKRPFPKFANRWRNSNKRYSTLGEAKNLPVAKDDIRNTDTHSDEQKIIFLADAFARYLEPETEQAAIYILSRCEYDVNVLPVIGAGASLYSKGFIEPAQRHAAKVLDALKKIDPAGEAVLVGIEPPEIYFLKDEYLDLLPSRSEEIQKRIKNTWLLDEYLLRSKKFNNLRIVNSVKKNTTENGTSTAGTQPGTTAIKFHPHCHQRAEGPSEDGLPGGTNATIELLKSCGIDVELMDTGCCGMAGTFGYEAEHYDLSMKVGELKLFPMLRANTDNQESQLGNLKSYIISSGAACRMQIKQGTGVDAMHPIVFLANFLKELANDKE